MSAAFHGRSGDGREGAMRPRLALGVLALGLFAGCVERRFVIDSDPPGAVAYLDGVPMGPTPVDVPFVYYGKYHITLVKDGYETQHIVEPVSAPWYAYPPLDFVTENLYPGQIRDVRRLSYTLRPVPLPQAGEMLRQAEELRQRSKAETAAEGAAGGSSANAPPAGQPAPPQELPPKPR
jgi:hypothetical protein